MLLEIFIAIFLGILIGALVGLIVGVHPNLVALVLFSLSPIFLQYVDVLVLGVFIISVGLTNTFVSTIPAIYLGAPSESENVLSVLPGHRMLLQGRGYEAFKLTVVGSLIALIVGVLVSPVLVLSVGRIYPVIRNYIGYILILAAIFLIFRENKKFLSLFVFIMAGVFGLGALNLGIRNPLFPLLSGMFGVAGLLISIRGKINIPKQSIEDKGVDKKETGKAVGSGLLVGTVTSMLPGIGPAQAAIIGSQLVKLKDEGFLILVGALSTLSMVLSFVALYVLDKARNGVVLILGQLIGETSLSNLVLFLGVALVVGGVSTMISLQLAKIFSRLIVKVNYKKVCIIIILFIFILSYFLSGLMGMFVLLIASFFGIVPVLLGVGRSQMMGVLMLPVILFFVL